VLLGPPGPTWPVVDVNHQVARRPSIIAAAAAASPVGRLLASPRLHAVVRLTAAPRGPRLARALLLPLEGADHIKIEQGDTHTLAQG
jgi:hypothetical protein